ncbi:MAG: PepSY-like domain-containing protein [Bacteroidales bacterium]|nr:PepSY-like domain-containing protein [Bacteroidales bacterium]
MDPIYQNGLEEIYPHAKRVEWDYDDGYLTAEFYDNGMEIKIWFDNNGNWLCVKTEMPFSKLPQNIKDAFTNSDYAHWRIDDIDYIQIRKDPTVPDVISYYEFDVEKGEMDREFVIYPDGAIADKPYYGSF